MSTTMVALCVLSAMPAPGLQVPDALPLTNRTVERVLADGSRERFGVADAAVDGSAETLPIPHGPYERFHRGGSSAAFGRFELGRPAGRWRFDRANGTKLARGEYRDGVPHGRWTFWYADADHGLRGKLTTGTFSLGQRSGKWEFWTEDGEVDVQRSGRVERITLPWPDGSPRIEAERIGGLANGRITVRWPDGSLVLEGHFELGRPTGTWRGLRPGGAVDRAWMADIPVDNADLEPDLERLLDGLPPRVALDGDGPVEPQSPAERTLARRTAVAALTDWLGSADGSGPTPGARIARALDVLTAPNDDGPAAGVATEASFAVLAELLGPLDGFGLDANGDPEAAARALGRIASIVAIGGDDVTAWALEARDRSGAPGPASIDVVEAAAQGPAASGETDPSEPPLDAALADLGLGTLRRTLRTRDDGEPRYSRDVAAAIEGGLGWLARHQSTDGSWRTARLGEAGCCPGPPPRCDGEGVAYHDIGLTGLALLAFADAGVTVDHDRFGGAVRDGLLYLVGEQQASRGWIGQPVSSRHLYDHSIATQALARHAASWPSPSFDRALDGAAGLLVRARNPYSAWRYEVPPSNTNSTSSTVWCVTALDALLKVRPEVVDPEAFRGALSWVDEVTDPISGRCGYMTMGGPSSRFEQLVEFYRAEYTEALTAAGIVIRLRSTRALGAVAWSDERQRELIQRGINTIVEKPARWSEDGSTNDQFYWFFGTQALAALIDVQPSSWKRWRAGLLRALLPSQRVSPACFAGSWDPTGPWGSTGGRIYSTALATSALAIDPSDPWLPRFEAESE